MKTPRSQIPKKVEQILMSWPGKRGIDIPEEVFDRIHPVATGITMKVWGRYPTPHQLQYLHDNQLHHPDDIHRVYDQMPHPHADGMTVGEFQHWSKAYSTFNQYNHPHK